jgi:hypothetical protein
VIVQKPRQGFLHWSGPLHVAEIVLASFGSMD